ncbi:MAG: serine acetyltransferase [Myxococcaceae bacterium]|nr:serine acetyltransferase [Myxococcaceae bacterium]
MPTLQTWKSSQAAPMPRAPEPLEAAIPKVALAAETSALVPNWAREACGQFEWHPSRQLIKSLRDYSRARERTDSIGVLKRKWSVLRHRFWSAVTGAEIPINAARIAGGLMMPHPNGVVIHPEAVIGPNCLIFQQVTIGSGPRPGVPKLGGHVDVGPGAKILGGVTIGDHAVIGANAVVVQDVPAGAVAVGVPAISRRSAVRSLDR